MKLLIFGDVVGKLGRAGVKIMLPKWREEFLPDVIIANIENILHGKGIGMKQIDELRGYGVNIFTGGNHSFEGKDWEKILNDETLPITRPANVAPGIPGRGVLLYKEPPLLVINLIGQVFMKQEYDNPFYKIDQILEEYKNITPHIILDWHAEATSEKTVMGWYLNGRVSLIFGTHTHVPTADEKILPGGTGYITDIGMVGPYNSIIGVEIEPAFTRFKENAKTVMQPVENGPIEINAVYCEINENGKAVDIKHLRKIVSEYSI